MEIYLGIIFISTIFFLVVFLISSFFEKERQKKIKYWAKLNRFEYTYNPPDEKKIISKYRSIRALRGQSGKASPSESVNDLLRGRWKGFSVLAFEFCYSYTTRTSNFSGFPPSSTTEDVEETSSTRIFILQTEKQFPKIIVYPRSWSGRVFSSLRPVDNKIREKSIDFDNKFKVLCKNQNFKLQFLSQDLINLLLDEAARGRKVSFEMHDGALVISSSASILRGIEGHFDFLVKIHESMGC